MAADRATPTATCLLYSWSLLSRPEGSTAALSNLTIVNPTFVADRDGVYVAQLTVSDGSLVSAPDTVAITAGPGADLAITLPVAPSTQSPGAGAGWYIYLENLSPVTAEQVTVHAPVPAGYTLLGFDTGGNGTWDPVTGIWTIGAVDAYDLKWLTISTTVNLTGPYDLSVSITNSSAPDPVLANNTASAIVTPNRNADLRASFLSFSTGTRSPGEVIGMLFDVYNDGPSIATDIVASFAIPAGFTIVSASASHGTYDGATGVWTIGDSPLGRPARLTLNLRVNAIGSTGLRGAITGSSQPDPNLANNVIVPERINRPPVAIAGADQAVSTNGSVAARWQWLVRRRRRPGDIRVDVRPATGQQRRDDRWRGRGSGVVHSRSGGNLRRATAAARQLRRVQRAGHGHDQCRGHEPIAAVRVLARDHRGSRAGVSICGRGVRSRCRRRARALAGQRASRHGPRSCDGGHHVDPWRRPGRTAPGHGPRAGHGGAVRDAGIHDPGLLVDQRRAGGGGRPLQRSHRRVAGGECARPDGERH